MGKSTTMFNIFLYKNANNTDDSTLPTSSVDIPIFENFQTKNFTPLSLNPSYIYYIKNFHYIKLINKILLNNMCSI